MKSPRHSAKKARTSSSSSASSSSPRPLRTKRQTVKGHQPSHTLKRSQGQRAPSPTPQPAFRSLAEVKARMRDCPVRDRKRKRKRPSRDSSSSPEDEDDGGDLASSTSTAGGMRRTRSTARIEECVQGVDRIQFSDQESDPEDELGDPDDEYYLHHAIPSQLSRLRKDKLVQLWSLLLQDYPGSRHALENADVDPQDLSKQALVSSLLRARDGPRIVRSEDDGLLPRMPTRSTSLPSLLLDPLPDTRPKHGRSTSLAETPRKAGRMLRSTSTDRLHHQRLPSFGLDLEDIEEDRSMREPTPVAKRTRASAARVDSGQSRRSTQTSEDGDSSDGDARILRNGKMVPLEAPASPDAADFSFESADVTEEPVPIEVSSGSESEDDEEEEAGNGSDEVAFDFAVASAKTLLRLKRDELVVLCEERALETGGTKRQLADRLLEWREAAASADEEDDESEADTSFQPDGSMDTSFVSAGDDSEAGSSGAETETEEMHPPRTVRGRKNETKTQALAKVDRTSHNRDGTTPLVDDLKHVDNRPRPPGPGRESDESESEEEEEDNAVGLDLESLNLQDKAILPSALVKGDKIGSGGFKDVQVATFAHLTSAEETVSYKGKYRNVRVAIADIRGHMTENEIKELELLRDLRHDNIVKLIGVVAYDPPSPIPCSLVTELCLNGDLFDYIRRDAPPPSFDKMIKIMLDIASGLDYLHKHTPKIIHRDMKSSNVLITARGVAKITDFGLARVKNSTRSMVRSLVGTVNWQAPELWVPHPRYNEKVDCFAAGMIYWEMLQWHQPVKKFPFEGMNEHAIYREVGQRQQRPPTTGIARHWGAEVLQVVSRMWAQLPGDRPSMSEVENDLHQILAEWKIKRK